jgi:DNA-binding HxlR family transcriptional regulator
MRHFRELLSQSMEGISSNTLSERLKKLVDSGMLTKSDDPSHRQKAIYNLTEMAITLVPLLAHLGAWGRRCLPASKELSIRAQLLENAGPKMWEQFMEELRVEHLGKRKKHRGPTVAQRLQSAYEASLGG